jgi:hypothetical protein
MIKITLDYKGQEFNVIDDTTPLEQAEYLYTEGNYACDCNKSLFIARYCNYSFEHELRSEYTLGNWILPCGDTIKLVKIEPLYQIKS